MNQQVEALILEYEREGDFLRPPLDGSTAFAEETEEHRPDGLPDGLVAVENCDEWLYCIDCSNGKVVSWSPYDGDGVVEVYEDFDSCLLDRFNDAIENM